MRLEVPHDTSGVLLRPEIVRQRRQHGRASTVVLVGYYMVSTEASLRTARAKLGLGMSRVAAGEYK